MREYDLIADWYASERAATPADGSGVPEVIALAASIRPRGRVLDIGCGHGVPLRRRCGLQDIASCALKRWHHRNR
jgi:2-polyprenyl-3-methyl-5-hydroxy-6-metoxy-1,4-benzoquinol methylase